MIGAVQVRVPNGALVLNAEQGQGNRMNETIAADASPGPDQPAAGAPDAPPPVLESAAAAAPAPIEHPFEFRGDEREYFRIWIVNLALTILTLGIYSAWAKVRTERYFYASTRVAGTPFEYLARPLPILKGRIIAFTLFTSYILASRFSLKLQLALLVLIGLLSPWLIVRGLMFRARYSSWRGLTFRFVPDYWPAYKYYLLMYVLFPLTLGLIYPYMKWRQKQFLVTHHRFGRRDFDFSASANDFYIPYFIATGMMIGFYIALATVLSAMISGIGARGSGVSLPVASSGARSPCARRSGSAAAARWSRSSGASRPCRGRPAPNRKNRAGCSCPRFGRRSASRSRGR